MTDFQLSRVTTLWLDIPIILAVFAAVLILWCRDAWQSRTSRWILRVMLAAYLVVYVWLTVICRTPFDTRQTLTEPFRSYRLAFDGLRIRSLSTAREILLNILVYVPLGMMIPAILCRTGHPLLWTALAGLLLSALTEAVQLVTHLGYFETDDLINNTLGCLIGMAAITAAVAVLRQIRHRKE